MMATSMNCSVIWRRMAVRVRLPAWNPPALYERTLSDLSWAGVCFGAGAIESRKRYRGLWSGSVGMEGF